MMVRSALCKTNMLSWIFIVLAHWHSNPRIYMSLHSDTLFRFWANQSLLFSPYCSNQQSTALEASTLTITHLIQLYLRIFKVFIVDYYCLFCYLEWFHRRATLIFEYLFQVVGLLLILQILTSPCFTNWSETL
jgi:hypothetical protein